MSRACVFFFFYPDGQKLSLFIPPIDFGQDGCEIRDLPSAATCDLRPAIRDLRPAFCYLLFQNQTLPPLLPSISVILLLSTSFNGKMMEIFME